MEGGLTREGSEKASGEAELVLDLLADAGERVRGLRGRQSVGGMVDAPGQRVLVCCLFQTGERAGRLWRVHRARLGAGGAAVGGPMLVPGTVTLVVRRVEKLGARARVRSTATCRSSPSPRTVAAASFRP